LHRCCLGFWVGLSLCLFKGKDDDDSLSLIAMMYL
jgi:hypothetical protein